MEKSKEKVYCGTCVYLRSMYGTEERECSHKDNRTEEHTPLEIVFRQKNIVECNTNNDCKLYEKDRKPEIVKAFDAIDDKSKLDGFIYHSRGGYSITRFYVMPNGTDFIEVYQGHISVITKEEFLKAKEELLKAELKACKEASVKASEQTTEKSLDERKCWPLFWRKR